MIWKRARPRGVRAPSVFDTPVDRRTRIALYSHDTMGLGHMRRNLLIAQTLATSELQPDLLLITGAPETTAFSLPLGVDCLTLPTLYKSEDGRYRPRQLRMSLPDVIALRSNSIRAALVAFEPDLLVVDNVPRGAVHELDPVLKALRRQNRTRCVLGLRDILDDPEVVRREWARVGNEAVIRAYYDAIWIYGDPAVYDSAREYGFPPDIAARTHFVGYLDQRRRLAFTPTAEPHPLDQLDLPPGELVLCLVGGGQDGSRLAEAFSQADLPPDVNGVILTGPHMPRETRQRLLARADGHPRLRVVEFLPEPGRLWERANRVITMGGYNSVCEALSYGTPTLVVPRVVPRREQLIRAERLRDLGFLDMLHPDAVSADTLTDWMRRPVFAMPPGAARIDRNGLDRLPKIVEATLTLSPVMSWDETGSLEVAHAAT